MQQLNQTQSVPLQSRRHDDGHDQFPVITMVCQQRDILTARPCFSSEAPLGSYKNILWLAGHELLMLTGQRLAKTKGYVYTETLRCRGAESPFNAAATLVETHPASLLHGAVGVAVQAGENGSGWHHFNGLVPAVSVAETRRVALTFPIQDGIQPGNNTGNNGLMNRGSCVVVAVSCR